MTAAIRPEDWLRFIEQEYLSTFIVEGGSTIKFVVPLEESVRAVVLEGLTGLGQASGYLVAKIDSAETKVHMVDEIFFQVARQLPWRELSRRVVANLVADAGYSWVESSEDPLYRSLAEHNQIDPQMLRLDLKKAITSKVLKSRTFSRDFRVAMTHLCNAELFGGEDGVLTRHVLTDWLTGQNKAVSAMKPYEIFRRINRTTARYLFESLVHWIRLAGYPGVLILMDAQRVVSTSRPLDQSLFYSKAAVLDAYEVLRQFIDGADRLEGCFLAIVSDVAFLEDPMRGIGAYEALKFRVFDEVRDKRLVNPMASLTRISSTLEGVGSDGQ